MKRFLALLAACIFGMAIFAIFSFTPDDNYGVTFDRVAFTPATSVERSHPTPPCDIIPWALIPERNSHWTLDSHPFAPAPCTHQGTQTLVIP